MTDKQTFDRYRRAARNRVHDYVKDHPTEADMVVTVPEWANVQQTEDGAFVEALIWVPKAEAV